MGTVAVFFVGLEEESDRAGPAVISGELRCCPQKHCHVAVVPTGVHTPWGARGIGTGDGLGDEQPVEFGAKADGAGTRAAGQTGDNACAADTGGDLIAEFGADCGDICGGLMFVEVRLGDLMEGMTPGDHLRVVIGHGCIPLRISGVLAKRFAG